MIWVISLVGMLGYSVYMFTGKQSVFVSSIYQIFPEFSQNTVEAKALERSKEQLSNTIVFLIGHQSREELKVAREVFEAKVKEISFIEINQPSPAEIDKLHQFQSSFRGQLVSDHDLQLLRKGQHHPLINNALLNLFGPSSLVSGQQLKEDPLGLYQRYLEDLSQAGNDRIFQAKNDLYYFQIVLSISADEALGISTEQITSELLSAADLLVKTYSGIDVTYTGSPFYSAQIAKTSKSSAYLITAVALTGILILFLINFRSLQSIIGATLIISSGVITGAAALLTIFNSVHLIAVAFGSSLVGVVIDYAIHFYATRRNEDTAATTALRIRPGLVLAVLTTCLGFIALLFVEIALLRQIAVYAVFGVLGAMLSVLLLLPQSKLGMAGKGLPNPRWNFRSRHYACLKPFVLPLLIILSLMIAAAIGGAIVPVSDNVQNLRVNTPELAINETKIANLGGFAQRRNILLEGSSLNALLRNEEILIDRLKDQNPKIEFFGVSKLLPSMDRQQEICALKAAVMTSEAATKLGKLVPITATECSSTAPDTSMMNALPDFAKELVYYKDQSQIAAIVLQLNAVPANFNMQEFLGSGTNARELNVSRLYSQAFAGMREQATVALLVGMLVITMIFSIAFGIKKGIAIAIVPTMAALLSLILSAYLGAGLSVFSIMAAFLVYALGADYALFQQASEQKDDARAYKAVALSSVSTLLVFSLATLSAIPVLQIMGSVIVMGVVIAWGIAPIARTFSRGDMA